MGANTSAPFSSSEGLLGCRGCRPGWWVGALRALGLRIGLFLWCMQAAQTGWTTGRDIPNPAMVSCAQA